MTLATEADLGDIGPIDIPPSDTTFGEPTVEAPYGYKADGTPYKRNRKIRAGGSTGYRGTSTGSKGRRGSLEKEIGGLIVMVNLPLQMIPATQRDALDQNEITALAKALDKECQVNPTLRKYVEQAIRAQGGTSLVAIVAMIAARRVVRHEIIPIPEEIGGSQGMDLLIGQAINASSNLSVFSAAVPPAATETTTTE